MAVNNNKYKEETAQEAAKIRDHDPSNTHGVKTDELQTKPNILHQEKMERPVRMY